MICLSFLLSNLLDKYSTFFICMSRTALKLGSLIRTASWFHLDLVRFRGRNDLVSSGRDSVVNVRGTTRLWLKDANVACR